MLSQTWRSDIRAGGTLRAQALGKWGGGATLAATGIYYASSGIVTGGGPTDPTLRRSQEELTGWKPYSVRIGDTYYSYGRLSPLGSLLGMVADYTEIRGSIDDAKAEE